MVKTLPSNAGGVGSIPVWGTKILHASWPKKKNTERESRSNTVTNSRKIFKMVHIKKS